jgi:aspartyl/asparaginyl beta-hydroxylase (cupin superfamily)
MNKHLALLKQHWHTVYKEALASINSRQSFPEADDVYFEGWKFIPFKNDDRYFPSVHKRFPDTWKMIEPLQGISRSAILTLEPGGKLDLHTGPHGGEGIVWRGHLALQTNPDAYMVIEGKQVPWVEGEWLFFDDQVQHGAFNEGADLRIILAFGFLKSHWNLTEEGPEYKY